jgi:predicted DNA-binding protein
LSRHGNEPRRRTPGHAPEAIHEFLDDREDYFLAKDSLQAFVDAGEESLGIEDLDWDTPGR